MAAYSAVGGEIAMRLPKHTPLLRNRCSISANSEQKASMRSVKIVVSSGVGTRSSRAIPPSSIAISPLEEYGDGDNNVVTTDRGFDTTDQSEAEALFIEWGDKTFTYSGHVDTMPDFGGETLSYDELKLPSELNADPGRNPLLCGETLLIPDAEGGWFTFSQN